MPNTRSLIIGIIVIILVIVGAVVLIRFLRSNRTTKPTTNTAVVETQNIPDGTKVSLEQESRSKESGTATIAEVDGSLRIYHALQGAPTDTLQYSGIYMGTCDDLGNILYPLSEVFNGQSVSTIEVTKERLNNQKPLAFVVRQNNADSSKVSSCGNL